MPARLSYPGVSIEEMPFGVRTIVGGATSIAAFVGAALRGPTNEPTTITSFGEFERIFGGLGAAGPMSYAVQDFYLNGGGQAVIVRLVGNDGGALGVSDYRGDGLKTGISALNQTEVFNVLCLPPPTIGGNTDHAVWTEAAAYCIKRRAFLLIDPPTSWTETASAKTGLAALYAAVGSEGAKSSGVYFPLLLRKDAFGLPQDFVPCGAVAGVITRTDAQRGVWKAPAGLEAAVVGADALSVTLSAHAQRQLNSLGINCLRILTGGGHVIYGARTLAGNDLLASEGKYVPVRRLALFLEELLFRGTQGVVFEPNDEPLWAQIRDSVGAFLHGLFRQGAFQGGSAQDAYYVRCDGTTTTETDRNRGVVNIEVGFAPLNPAEFVVIRIQQLAGQPV